MQKTIKSNGFIFNIINNKNEFHDYDLVNHNGAICCLLIDEIKQEFVLVEQFRYPLQTNMIEILAGKIEPEETSLVQGIKREAIEEMGCDLKKVEYIDTFMPSSWYSDEKISLFYATEFEFSFDTNFDETEDVKIVRYTFKKAIELIKNNIIFDAKTQYAIMRYLNEWK